MTRRFRIIVLGAGFSRPAGLPLARELWVDLSARALRLEGRAGRFQQEIEWFRDYVLDCTGKKPAPDEIDFEHFMRYLDLEHFLGMRGSDTWSDEGNEATIVTKTLIGQIISERMSDLRVLPKIYLEFARRLEVDDVVITFNYDTLVERALEHLGKPYRLFHHRFDRVTNDTGYSSTDRNEVVVLKMHGSIDWFDRAHYDARIKVGERSGYLPSHPLFDNSQQFGLRPVVDGPRFEDDPLNSVMRATQNLDAIYQSDMMFHATPRLLAPSGVKFMYSPRFNDFWRGIDSAGPMNLGMAIVGYSLPAEDEYARQIMHSMVTQYQRKYWTTEFLGRRKCKLALVDLFRDDAARRSFRRRYRFVNWRRAVLRGTGFDNEALDEIFA